MPRKYHIMVWTQTLCQPEAGIEVAHAMIDEKDNGISH